MENIFIKDNYVVAIGVFDVGDKHIGESWGKGDTAFNALTNAISQIEIKEGYSIQVFNIFNPKDNN